MVYLGKYKLFGKVGNMRLAKMTTQTPYAGSSYLKGECNISLEHINY